MSAIENEQVETTVQVSNPLWDLMDQYWPREKLMNWRTRPNVFDGYPYPRSLKEGEPLPEWVPWRNRHELVRDFTWAIPHPDAITWIVEVLDGRPLVEIGAGTGYWCWQLQQHGVKATPYDRNPPRKGHNEYHSHRRSVTRRPTAQEKRDILQRYEQLHHLWELTLDLDHATRLPEPEKPDLNNTREFLDTYGREVREWTHVRRGGPEVLLRKSPEHVLFLCWPPMSELAGDCLSAFKGDTLIYQGEGWGGCTGDDSFFKQLSFHWDEVSSRDFASWGGINDYLTVYRRRAVPRTDAEARDHYFEES